MIKNLAMLGLCLAFLLLSSAFPVEGSKTYAPGDYAISEAGPFLKAQENSHAISLPEARGAWLIEMSRDGGMRPSRYTVQINSDGELSVTSSRYIQGRLTIECSLKEKLSAEDLLKLKRRVRSSKFSAWRENYEDPKNPVCCDQPTTRLTLQRRGAAGAQESHKTSWYPSSSQLRPADIVSLADITGELWNNARARCENQSAE